MVPAVERFVVGIAVVALDDRREAATIEGLDELAENGRLEVHVPPLFLSRYNQKIPRNLIEFPGFAGYAPRHFESPATRSPDSRA
ncbi:MAG: hypothetical protein ACHP7H_08480, partial [Hyphomicrobiales bacterium]